MSLFALPFLLIAASPTAQTRVVAACDAWLAGRHDSQVSGETHAVGDAGLCFDGQIDHASAGGFLTLTRAKSDSAGTVVVVRSVGGTVDEGIAMGNEIRRLGATVISKTICLSSCANYLIGAAKVRAVLPGALLGFHGGALHTPLSTFESGLRAQKVADAPARARTAFAKSEANVRAQNAFLAANGIDPDIFGWMDRFNALSSARKQEICPGSDKTLVFLVFAPDLLARHGMRIQEYHGPTSAGGLDAALGKLGLPAAVACYVGNDAKMF